MREEFGYPRTTCDCNDCQINCRFMPGFLIPADLDRMIPEGVDPFKWAETNLLASPGAVVMKDGVVFRIPTLVSATKPDGSCVHLSGDGRCDIHEVAPFGCAFFDCGPERGNLSKLGLMAVFTADEDSLYTKLIVHLVQLGKTQKGPEVLRARIAKSLR